MFKLYLLGKKKKNVSYFAIHWSSNFGHGTRQGVWWVIANLNPSLASIEPRQRAQTVLAGDRHPVRSFTVSRREGVMIVLVAVVEATAVEKTAVGSVTLVMIIQLGLHDIML